MKFSYSGATVVATTVIVTNCLRIISSVILTRLLNAEAFGILGVIASVSTIFQLASDIGIQSFVVRHKDGDDKSFLDQVWTIRLIRCAALTSLIALSSGAIAAYVHKPEIQPIIIAASLTFLLDGTSSLNLITSIRQGKILRISALDVLAAVIQLIFSVIMAFVFRSVWGVIIAILATGVLKSILSYVLFRGSARRWNLDAHRVKEMWKFSRYITGSSILTMILSQTDKAVLSTLMPLAVFGLYIVAASIAQAPWAFSHSYASRVLAPIYARTWREDQARLASVYYGAKRRLSLLYMFGAGALIATAPLIIRILYDPRYEGSALFLQLLSIGLVLALNNNAAMEAMIAAGRLSATMTVNFIRVSWLAGAGFVLFKHLGPVGLVGAVGTIEVPAQLYSWYCLRRLGLFNLRQEMLLLATGASGLVGGYLLTMLILPLLPA